MTSTKVLRTAIVGCGKIADQHVEAMRRAGDCTLVAVCDRDGLMAEQLGERAGAAAFSDLGHMLTSVRPDVVHITTPPQGHFVLAQQCLSFGANVYLEKPFTLTADDACELIDTANQTGLKLTAGHNYQFTLEMLEMRRLVSSGFLGGRPVHVESHWPYDLSDRTYAAAMLGSHTHWVRQLPGKLLHNLISHGVAKLAEFLDDELVEIKAVAGQSATVQELDASDIIDELRVLIKDRNGTTGFFCFSSQIKPGLNWLRISGPRNSIEVDHMSGSVIRHRGRAYKSYLTYLVRPFVNGSDHLRSGFRNIQNFCQRKLYHDFGMKELVRRFYDSIRTGGDVPIPYRQILLTARIMDEIFAQIYPTDSTGRTQECERVHANSSAVAVAT